MLSPYRVLDLTNHRGLLCGQMLGDLGADVIQIEPPGGSPARALGPFLDDHQDLDRSLYWWAHTRNKRSVTLGLDATEGQALLREMIPRADFLIESDMPGVQVARGLGYAAMAAINPALVYVSISPFGQTGPKASYADSDLVLMAAAGPLVLTGDDDRPPLRMSVPQAYSHASAEAAVAALVAHHERQRSGKGQHVDVSAQQAIALATQSSILSSAVGFFETLRMSGGARVGPITVRFVYPAKDGHVSITHMFGSAVGPFTRRLMEYIHGEGGCDEATRDKDWNKLLELIFTGQDTFDELERIKRVIADFTGTKTKAELFATALERGLLIAPVATTKEVVESEQLATRDYWQTLEHPELGRSFRYPGPFGRASAKPIRYRRRPPTIGEHNREIYVGELGLSEERIRDLSTRQVV